ncbi:MAG: hypothetical protein PHO56_04405 [Patescibacteria group bacterium]|nr:hypothetical protein [Patescibacteria group bacterium]
METKTPEFGMMGNPIWFHHHGSKMRLTLFHREGEHIAIDGSATHLRISMGLKYYEVTWSIKHSPDEYARGRTLMDKKTLANAFGLANDTPNCYSHWLIERYGGDNAEQFKFIRYRNYLNIPCPGTGNDGDPNISIELDDEIKQAVTKLLS